MLGNIAKLFGFSDDNYSDAEQKRLAQRGLLNFASAMLSTPGGFGNGLAAGTQGLLGAMDRGAEQMQNDRYQKSIMERMQGNA